MTSCDTGFLVGAPITDYGVVQGNPSVPPIPDAPNETWYYVTAPDDASMCAATWDGYTNRTSDNDCGSGFCGTGQDSWGTPPTTDHVYAIGTNFQTSMADATMPTAPTGYSTTTTVTPPANTDDTFLVSFSQYFTGHVLVSVLALMALFVGVSMLMGWGKRAARSR